MFSSQHLCRLFSGDITDYHRFIDELFSRRVADVFSDIPFYRDHLASKGLTPADFRGISDLSKLPVVDRRTLQSRPVETFVSAAALAAGLPSPAYTSGTSGEPLQLYASRDFYIASFHLMQLAYGGSVPFTASCLSEVDRVLPEQDDCQVHFIARSNSVAQLFERLKEIRPQVALLGPRRWRKLVERYGHELADLNLVVAGAAGAASTPEERAYLSGFVGCPVVDMYGATELGGAIFECPRGREHVLAHHNYLEILDDDGNPAAPGHSGNLVWTALDNSIMPLIRYQIGDTGQFAVDQECDCGWNGPIVQGVGGKAREKIVFPTGMTLNAFKLNVEVHRTPGPPLFDDYRFRQAEADLIRLSAVRSNDFSEDMLGDLLSRIEKLLGGHVRLELVWVDAIDQPMDKPVYFVSLEQSRREAAAGAGAPVTP
ncbi:phenylacetate--CoA ligase family protein [Kitasatospora mediocidica]|uniref:phenylacetate--CoA ligase family protein n=1 Tax=Kitasatospora mediocidica TaxID=58352 RepID=UPI00056AD21F|nr:AMP-binding protein [Kitasatospora mediocidica]